MAICDWPAGERPREKLLSFGAAALSDAELLAIFLRTGCAGKSAVDLARDLLKEFGSLRALLDAELDDFCRAKGLGHAKFSQLQASLEMARRHLAETLTQGAELTSSGTVKSFLASKLRHLSYEVFAALFLDTQHRLIAYEELFTGTLNAAAVYPREVAVKALKHRAAAIIFAHNHPSGISEPSRQDRDLTLSLSRALAMLDIRTLDHMIVGEDRVYSFAEHGLL